MQPRAEFLAAASRTPKTAEATFTITAKDVGTSAVRPGHMAELEQDRTALLLAGKLVLQRLRAENITIGAAHEFALEAVIKAVEA